MSPPTRVIHRCAFLALMALAWTTASSQILAPQSTEYPMHAPMAGDQTFPALGLTSEGGFLAWRDNGIDRGRPGIASCRLDSTFNGIAEIFRVNRKTSRDPKGPSVAVLAGGGAVLAWEDGQPGEPDVFLRFVREDGRFLGNEVTLNPKMVKQNQRNKITRMSWRNNKYKEKNWRIRQRNYYIRDRSRDPKVAPLPDGGAVVVYSGVRRFQTNTFEIVTEIKTKVRRGVTRFYTNDVLRPVSTRGEWKQDVFFQRFDSRGKPAGEEVVVNQFVEFNQRQPNVAALADGRFVVAWVSEKSVAEIPGAQSVVVISARLFSAEGEPLSDEFQVNTENRPCAQPAVAGLSGGRFTVVWNQRDLVRSNNWDIYVRTMASGGGSSAPPHRLNEHTYGDQFCPVLSRAGLNQLVVWTSLGQDGSREGVYGRIISEDGPAGSEFQVNTVTRGQQFQPAVAGDGDHRFLVVWSSFGGSTGFDLAGQRYRSFDPLPRPEAPSVSALSESSLHVTWAEAAAVNLSRYELFMDEATVPNALTATEFTANGLESGSTHSFQLAYVLSDGRRSLLSPAGVGTTLSATAPEATPVTETESPGGGFPPGPAVSPTSGQSTAPVFEARLSRVEEGLVLKWNARPGQRYQVQISDDLQRWIDFGDARLAESEAESVTLNPKEVKAFFRVVQLP
jgi:hypothetical protein